MIQKQKDMNENYFRAYNWKQCNNLFRNEHSFLFWIVAFEIITIEILKLPKLLILESISKTISVIVSHKKISRHHVFWFWKQTNYLPY